MLVAASPDYDDYDETVQVLKFGALTKKVDLQKASLAQSAAVAERRERQRDVAGRENAFGFDGRRVVDVRESPEDDDEEMAIGREEAAEIRCEDDEIVPSIEPDVVDDDANDVASDRDDVVLVSPRDVELAELRQELVDVQSKALHLESAIRAEVAAEMATRLEEMEASYRAREEEAIRISEDTVERRVENLRKKDASDRNDGGGAFCTRQDAEELAEQIEECEEEMERMREVHKSEVETLQRRAAERSLCSRQEIVAKLLGNPLVTPSDEVRAVLETCFRQPKEGSRVFQEFLTKRALRETTVPNSETLRTQIEKLRASPGPSKKQSPLVKTSTMKKRTRVEALRAARKATPSPGQERFRRLVERFDSPSSAVGAVVASPRSPTLCALSGQKRVLRQSNRLAQPASTKRKSPTTTTTNGAVAKRTRSNTSTR